MIWGTFTPVHIATLAAGAGLLVFLYFILRNKTPRTQTAVLGVLSFFGYVAIVYGLVAKGAPLANLPLHLCSVNAILLPVVVFTRNKTLGNLLLVWCLGALAALVLNYEHTETPLFTWRVFFYYFPHLVEFGIPILLVLLGHVKKDPKCILSTMLISLGTYTAVHFLNLAVNAYTEARHIVYWGDSVYQANYMFSIYPNNPLVELFYSWIPHSYWYMFLILPIVFVYLVIIYSPEIYRKLRRKEPNPV